jgi:hypothetical protein
MRVMVMEYVLTDGRPFRAAPRPAEEAKQDDGQCFAAAHRYVALHPDHLYVEGFALDPSGTCHHHAWAASPTGEVVDLVWSEPESCEYLGVPFSARDVAELLPEGSIYEDILEAAVRRVRPGASSERSQN